MRYTILLLCILSVVFVKAETRSETYAFLNMPTSAKIAALGGANVSITTPDVNMVYQNPALLQDTLNNSASLSYVSYLLDTKTGFLSYAHKFEKVGMLSFGLHYVSYGSFDGRDASDVMLGEFNAKEYAFYVAGTKKLSRKLQAGITFKPVYSVLEKYQSFGLLVDMGLHFRSLDNNFGAGLVFRNIGRQISTYTDNDDEKVPFNIVLGASYKLSHAPFRFSATFNELDNYDLVYTSVFDESSSVNDDEEQSFSAGEKLFRHLVFGVDFMPSKNFFVSFGYNFRRKQELKIEEKVGTVGLSWGFGLRVSKFHVSYGSARYHLSGNTNHITISRSF